MPAYIENKMHTPVLNLQVPAWSSTVCLSTLTPTTPFLAYAAPVMISPLHSQKLFTPVPATLHLFAFTPEMLLKMLHRHIFPWAQTSPQASLKKFST